MGDGPVFPAACTTKIPALTADSKAMSMGLKKVAMPGGRLFGVIDKLIMSTPSCAAYERKRTKTEIEYDIKPRVGFYEEWLHLFEILT